MTREIEVVFSDGERQPLRLDNHASRPGEPTLLARLNRARDTGEIVTIGGVPCQIVDLEDPATGADPLKVTADVSWGGQ